MLQLAVSTNTIRNGAGNGRTLLYAEGLYGLAGVA